MKTTRKPANNMDPAWRRMVRQHQGRTLVELCRRPKIRERIAGFIVGFSDELLLLHMLDWNTFTLSGYVILRDRDIEQKRFFSRETYWQKRAVQKLNLKPKPITKLRLTNWTETVADLRDLYPLVHIERELKFPGKCQIGQTIEVSARQIVIESLNVNAEWTGPYRMKLDDVTRIEFDGGYERALAATMPKRSNISHRRS